MKFNHTGHVELWQWLSDNPRAEKEAWPGWKHNGGHQDSVFNACFACEYTNITNNPCGTGEGCPLIWEKGNCQEETSLYLRWEHSCAEASFIAIQIANLPVKEGVECE